MIHYANEKEPLSEEAYHYPHEVVELLVDTIPRLVRSKESVVDFFRNCGVPADILHPLRERLAQDRSSITTFAIARTILKRVNEGGDKLLGVRRKIIQRVVEWEDFSTTWPDKRLEAVGLVSQVRTAVQKKDSFTRMDQERERENRDRVAARRAEAKAAADVQTRRADIRSSLADLMNSTNPGKRGIQFENALNSLFSIDGVLVREQFSVNRDYGTFEQIDGLVSASGQLYLVEVKWWKERLGPGDISQHMVRLMTRRDARGLFISTSGYTHAAIESCRTAQSHMTLILGELAEILYLLETGYSVQDWITSKATVAIADRNPLHRYGLDFY